MWQYNYSIELYHHGIKGMRWGIRRFQKKDGSLTNIGKKRYDDSESFNIKTKTKHRIKLEQKYIKGGLSKKDAEIAADKRIKKEKIIAAAATITVAAATAYVVNKHLKEKCDSIIKSGKTLQRIEMQDTGGKLYDQFYAAKDRADKTKYAGMLGKTRMQQTGHAYIMDIGVNKDIKIAGRDKAIKTFEKLYKNDSDFKNAVESMSRANIHGGNVAKGNMKKMYDNFNSSLVKKRDSDAVKKFYSALKSEGYGAIKDMNDSKFSGYKAKNPLIIFDHAGKVSVNSFKEMSAKDVDKKLAIIGIKEVAKSSTIPVSAIAVTASVEDNTIEKYKNKKRR